MRVDSRDFGKIKERTVPIVEQGIDDSTEYIKNNHSPNADDLEILVRNTLENVMDEIIQSLIDMYDFDRKDFDNFPPLDLLIYHKDGWTLNKSIKKHYEIYNKFRNKQLLIDSITMIIETESDRLCNTVYDEGNMRDGRCTYITIGGEDRCGGCGIFYGTFKINIDSYILPPYHPRCGCWALWHD